MVNQEYQKVFQAIESDFVFSDERDEDDHMVLVDENRNVNQDFKPKKSLVADMESQCLIRALEKETKREYMKMDGVKRPFPLISLYAITDKGYKIFNQ